MKRKAITLDDIRSDVKETVDAKRSKELDLAEKAFNLIIQKVNRGDYKTIGENKIKVVIWLWNAHTVREEAVEMLKEYGFKNAYFEFRTFPIFRQEIILTL